MGKKTYEYRVTPKGKVALRQPAIDQLEKQRERAKTQLAHSLRLDKEQWLMGDSLNTQFFKKLVRQLDKEWELTQMEISRLSQLPLPFTDLEGGENG